MFDKIRMRRTQPEPTVEQTKPFRPGWLAQQQRGALRALVLALAASLGLNGFQVYKREQIAAAPPCGVKVAELLGDEGVPQVAQASSKPQVQGSKASKTASKASPAKVASTGKSAPAKPNKTVVTAAKVD